MEVYFFSLLIYKYIKAQIIPIINAHRSISGNHPIIEANCPIGCDSVLVIAEIIVPGGKIIKNGQN